ncbi:MULTISPECIES: hypothetical protein [unclassified Sphingobacterium]|uniref:hypothetical protein n=1 Tax=unclassified Sphingobacterium TaxID=2609468 RepID=UPI0025EFB861|nr:MULTISPECIES: hypothetical protein [unclassified Sphingobacterium]
MKKVYFLIFCTLVLSCAKNDGINDNNTISIDDLQKSFYQQNPDANNPYFLNQSYKTSINWENVVESNDGSLYVKVNSPDTLNVTSNLRLENYLWLKAKKIDKEWIFSFIAFIPENVDSSNSFSGTIVTTYLPNKEITLELYNSYGPGFSLLAPRLPKDQDCIYGYVNGQLNALYCGSGSTKDDYDKWLKGNPKDYMNTNPSKGGSPGGGNKGNTGSKVYVENYITNPCLKKVVDEIISNDIASLTNECLLEVFKQNDKVNLRFYETTGLPDLTSGVAKTTYRSGSPYLDVNIELNVNTLPNASQEYIATTTLHESIHAYLYTKGYFNQAIGQHDVMWSNYIDVMAGYLNQNYGTDINEAQILATDGLYNTFGSKITEEVYTKLINKKPFPSDQRSALIEKYRLGQKGKKCNN